ncbi:MAG TPA: AtpZ/AtpI family protein [Aestuariivirga sp.]|nr:AtpZ/AtpI family protein [Alphaproteobacteria bacterium]HRX36404.1 AtpZ/AtpI family protein [Aestuariivirga sp.]
MNEPGDKPTEDRFKEFGQRLDASLEAQKARDDDVDATDAMAAGFAMRAITEILVALGVCTVAGYFLDRYFGTTPWLMIILMPIGQAAGIWNVMRMSRSKQADAILGQKGPLPPSVPDDDED